MFVGGNDALGFPVIVGCDEGIALSEGWFVIVGAEVSPPVGFAVNEGTDDNDGL